MRTKPVLLSFVGIVNVKLPAVTVCDENVKTPMFLLLSVVL